MKAVIAAVTDVGLVRDHNEDGFLAEDPILVVADGMGGHLGGEVASRTALETFAAAVAEAEAGVPDMDALAAAIRRANTAVFERGSRDPEVAGMGTTMTAAAHEGAHLRIAHVGDSRAYLMRDRKLRALTEDHTLVGEMVRDGSLSERQARTHPRRSIITRALGTGPEVEVDRIELDLRAGDRLLLCSDGLNGMIDDDAIAKLLTAHRDTREAADALVAAARDAGGADNITVVLADFTAEQADTDEHTEARMPEAEKPEAGDGSKQRGLLSRIFRKRA